MNPLYLFISIVIAAVLLIAAAFFGMKLLEKLFGQERIEAYFKMRTQGPFVPTPEDRVADLTAPIVHGKTNI